jgi:two-component system LytT family response regulator
LITAVEKVSQRIRLQNENERIRQLHQNTLHPNNPKIVPATGDRVEFVEVKNIIRCQGECNYTHLYFTDKKPLLVAKSLIEFEELLGEYDFIRVHKTHLISLNHVASFNRNNVGILVVSNGDHVSISRRRKDFTISQLKKVLKFS